MPNDKAQEPTQQAALDPRHYRDVMGHYPTGVAVVTGWSAEGEPIGMVVGSFASVSLDPPLVSFMPTIASGTYALMKDSPSLCINVLAHDQLDLCRSMAVPRPGKFDDVAWSHPDGGAPTLDGAVTHIQCHTSEVITAGDHYIVLCTVDAMDVHRPTTPLLFFQGGYGGFNIHGMRARGDAGLITALRLADRAQPAVEDLAHRLTCEAAVLVAVDDDELTTAVSAYGGDAEMTEALGARLPLIPPLGEAYVAFLGPEAEEAWLRRAVTKDDAAITRHRQRLDTVRRDGYALALLEHPADENYTRLLEALEEWTRAELTPARDRALRAIIDASQSAFMDNTIEDDRTYHVGSLVAPVMSPDGQVTLVLRLKQLPQGVPGSTVRGWVNDLKRAAAQVADELAGRSRTTYEEYMRDYAMHIGVDYMM